MKNKTNKKTAHEFTGFEILSDMKKRTKIKNQPWVVMAKEPLVGKRSAAIKFKPVMTFQGECLHCQASVFGPIFRPIVERRGLRCNVCNKLNRYQWTKTEYRQVKKAYDAH